MKTIDSNTHISIESKAPLSHTHATTLSLLYLPVIGKEAFSLYMLFQSLLERSTLKSPSYTHAFIYDMLGVCPEGFVNARKTLEAVGLIETYVKDDAYLMECYMPLSADAFIKDSPFAPYLYKAIGEERYKDLIAHFKITKTRHSDYTRKSVAFSDVFPPVKPTPTTRSQYVEPVSGKVSVNTDLDLDLVLEGIPSSLLKAKGRTKNAKDKLASMAYIYNFDEEALQDAIRKSLKEDGTIDFKTLSKYAQENYRKTRGPVTRKTDNASLAYFKEVHPRTLLEDLTGQKVPAADLKVIDRLTSETDMPLEVINVMIAYVLKELDQQFPVYNYFEKVVAEWKRLNIKTAADAINHVEKRLRKKREPKKQSRGYGYNKKSQPIDTSVGWFKDYLKEGKE